MKVDLIDMIIRIKNSGLENKNADIVEACDDVLKAFLKALKEEIE